MSATKRVTSWTTGINNVADPDALPVAKVSYNSTANVRSGARHVADASNVDFLVDGTVRSRTPGDIKKNILGTRMLQFKNEVIAVYRPANVGATSAIVALTPDQIMDGAYEPNDVAGMKILVSGTQMRSPYSIVTDMIQCGARLGEELFFFTTDGQRWRYDGGTTIPWGFSAPMTFPTITTYNTDGFAPGNYRLAMTLVDDYGQESPVSDIVEISETDSFVIQPSFTSGVNFYLTAPDGETFYKLLPSIYGGFTERDVHRAGARLEHMFCIAPEMGDIMEAFNSVLLIAAGNTLRITLPFRPHLHDPVSGFFQFPQDITNVISVADGVFITADKTYFLTGVETDTPRLEKVFDEPATKGSATRLTENKVVWMTKFGFVMAVDGGKAEFVHRDTFIPENITAGCSGRFTRQLQNIVVYCNEADVLPGFIPYPD